MTGDTVPLAQHVETQEALGMARTTIAELRAQLAEANADIETLNGLLESQIAERMAELAALRAAGGQEKPRHEFNEDVDDYSMCRCGVPRLSHDLVYPPAPAGGQG